MAGRSENASLHRPREGGMHKNVKSLHKRIMVSYRKIHHVYSVLFQSYRPYGRISYRVRRFVSLRPCQRTTLSATEHPCLSIADLLRHLTPIWNFHERLLKLPNLAFQQETHKVQLFSTIQKSINQYPTKVTSCPTFRSYADSSLAIQT